MRETAEKRHNDWKKAIRKKKIINAYGWDYYDNLHQYSKNKIHCSCPICSTKTNNRNRWGNHYNPPMSDKRKIEEMNYGIKEEIE